MDNWNIKTTREYCPHRIIISNKCEYGIEEREKDAPEKECHCNSCPLRVR